MKKRTYLKDLWSVAPLSWAIIRTPEVKLLSEQKFIHPILEVGCGDGLISQILFAGKKNAIDVGIDLDIQELRRAQKTGVYKKLIHADITNSNLKANNYRTVFANGVLEHIPNLDQALLQITRILQKSGQFITTSPTQQYSKLLFYVRLFTLLKLPHLALYYAKTINRVFAHHHLYDHTEWRKKFAKAGLTLKYYTYYNSPTVIAIHDIFLPNAMGTKFIKKNTDSMVLIPQLQRKIIIPLTTFFEKVALKSNPSIKKNASVLMVAEKV